MERTVNYERNLTGSYMITEAGAESFDEILIRRKKLSGILEMKRCSVNGNGEFWYNITGKQSLDTLYSIRKASMEQLKDVILQVCIQLENLEKNLISTDCLVLNPRFIFADNQTRKLYFMLDPEEQEPAADRFREMMEDLLAIMDHSDPEAVKAFYELYQISMDEGYSIADIRRAMEKKKNDEAKENRTESELQQPVNSGISENEAEHLMGTFDWNEKTEKDVILSEKEKKKRRKQEKKTEKQPGQEAESKEEVKEEHKEGFFKRWLRRRREKKQKEWEREEEELFGLGAEPETILPCVSLDGQNGKDDSYDRDETILVDNRNLRPEGILLYEGDEDYENIYIRDTTAVFGKGKEADFRLKRNTISRYHAQITKDDEGNYYLEDLNSTNGTYINEKIVNFREKSLLRTNDVIRFADLKYRFI